MKTLRSSPTHLGLCLLPLAVLLTGCLGEPTDTGAPRAKEPALHEAAFVFVETTNATGISFVHENGARGQFNYPEMMQGGVALIDIDADSLLDLYLVQSGPLPPGSTSARPSNRLYRNQGDGTFIELTEQSGTGDTGYGSAAAVGDVDGDGLPDLYVTNLGTNRLFRNRGDGTFEDWTSRARVAGDDEDYSTSAAFFDFDLDGDLDLFVANYVAWSPKTEHLCRGQHGVRGYCNPAEYDPQSDRLFRNHGDGTFEDVSRSSGIASLRSNGLGVVTADFDNDGQIDIYVANDQLANHLWRNQGDGTFVNEALLRGVALNDMGLAEAGMGVVAEDVDNDGDWDLFVTHLSHETNTFYRNDGEGLFTDTTDAMGLGSVSQPFTGFGVGFFDFDLDGRLDAFIGNGKVAPADAGDPEFAEPNQILRGLADGFAPAKHSASDFAPQVSRGAAFGDLDNDGDIDIVVANNAREVRVLRNDTPAAGHWLKVAVEDASGSSSHGAIVEVTTVDGGVDMTRRRQIQPASSYCASNSSVAHFGLGNIETIRSVEVTWPNGMRERRDDQPANQRLVFRQANGGP